MRYSLIGVLICKYTYVLTPLVYMLPQLDHICTIVRTSREWSKIFHQILLTQYSKMCRAVINYVKN